MRYSNDVVEVPELACTSMPISSTIESAPKSLASPELPARELAQSSEQKAAAVVVDFTPSEEDKQPKKRGVETALDRESVMGKEEKKSKMGKWDEDEHARLLEALHKYGNLWHKVREHVGTRTATQIRSHTQKHFLKQKMAQVREARQAPRGFRKIFAITREYLNRIPIPARVLEVPHLPRTQYRPKTRTGPTPSTKAVPVKVPVPVLEPDKVAVSDSSGIARSSLLPGADSGPSAAFGLDSRSPQGGSMQEPAVPLTAAQYPVPTPFPVFPFF